MISPSTNSLFDGLFRSAAACELFSDEHRLQSMLDFEAALAHVEAQLGLIPPSAASAIATCCRTDKLDLEAVVAGVARSGNLAIPMVSQLTKAVHAVSPEASGYVHWGTTSQDAIDTGFVLQLRDFLQWLDHELENVNHSLAALALKHRNTPMAGRTWLQQAVPITFGLKAAGWLDAMLRHRERLTQLFPRILVLQFGGAAGTLASLGGRGSEVAAALAQHLMLGSPGIPWHANRDRTAEVATFLGLLMGSLGKIARDLSLLGQTEIAEVAETSEVGRGSSSTMPHKRNPVAAAAVLSAALRVPGLVGTMLSAMTQEQERGLGGWHAEWETLPDICKLTAGALETMSTTLAGLQVFPTVMLENLEKTHGLVFAEAITMALAEKVGREQAHALVQVASAKTHESGRHLREVVESDPALLDVLGHSKLETLFDPFNYLGDTGKIIDSVLARYEVSIAPVQKRNA